MYYKESIATNPLGQWSAYVTLYVTFILLTVSIWTRTWPSFLNRLTKAQSKFLRCILYFDKIDSFSYIFSEYKLMEFSLIHEYFTLLLLFKTQRQGTVFRLRNNFVSSRNITNQVCPAFRITLFKNSIFSLGPRLLHRLPLHKNPFPWLLIYILIRKN